MVGSCLPVFLCLASSVPSSRHRRFIASSLEVQQALTLLIALQEQCPKSFPVQCRIRDAIDKMLQKDCVLSSLVAMEAALNDERFEVICCAMKTLPHVCKRHHVYERGGCHHA